MNYTPEEIAKKAVEAGILEDLEKAIKRFDAQTGLLK